MWKRKVKSFFFFCPLQSYSSTSKERSTIDTNANSFLKLLDTERLHRFPKLSSSQTNSLQHQTSSWRTSPECQLSFSSPERTSAKLTETVLSFRVAHCFKAAQQHEMGKHENLAAIAFSQFPALWFPQSLPCQGFPKLGISGQYRQTHSSTATSEQTPEHQQSSTAVAPLWGGCAHRATSGDPPARRG